MNKLITGLAVVVLAAAVTACGGDEGKVKKGVQFAKGQLLAMKRDPGAIDAYNAASESGKGVLGYLRAKAPADDSLAPFETAGRSKPYVVVVRGDGAALSWTIEGYFKDTHKPALVERVDVQGDGAAAPAPAHGE